MPQELDPIEHWVLPRETIELLPLVVTAGGSATLVYTISCVPNDGTRPSTYAAPTTAGGDTGYLVNGPTLTASGNYSFKGYVKIDSNPEDPVIPAFTLTLT